MLSYTKWILGPILAFGIMSTADTSDAQAQFGIYAGRGISINVGGGNFGYRSYYGPSYRSAYGHGSVIRYQPHYSRGHYDYHPTEVYRHGNHFHVQPGHYDYYPSGHHGHHGHHGHGGHRGHH